MSRALRVLSSPWLLARAMRRNGVGPVINFIVRTLRRRGLAGSLRLAVVDRDRRATVADEELHQAGNERFAGSPDLDRGYVLSPAKWAQWEFWIGAPGPGSDPSDDALADAEIAFTVTAPCMDEAARAALASTQAAVSVCLPGSRLRRGRDAPPTAGWVVFLSPGDQPLPGFARELVRATQGGVAEVVSFDMIRRTDAGDFQPLLFPGPNPTLYRAIDHLFGRIAVRASLLARDRTLRDVSPRAIVLDWFGRQPSLQARGRWRHVGRPIVEATITDAEVAGQQAAARDLLRRRPVGPKRASGAKVVICTRDRGHLTRQLVRGLLSRPPDEVDQVVIVANSTANPHALATLEDLDRESRTIVLRRDEPFNFSRLCNTGAAAVGGEGPLLFLNDDIAPVTEDWLPRLLARLESRPEIGAVGPLLLYPDERTQHAGMYLGFNGIAGHTLRGARPGEDDYLLYLAAPREVSCLTGAVLLTRRETFEALGGFDEQLATYLQDVDYGLRLQGSGWISVFDPSAILLHMESASVRGLQRSSAFHRVREAEFDRFRARWGRTPTRDRLHPSGFDLQDETLRRLATTDGRRPPENATVFSRIRSGRSG